MEVICPKCSKDTTFNANEEIKCSHCEHSFHKVRFAKKASIGAISGLLAGGAIGLNLDKWIEPNRYPVQIEYALIEACTQGASNYGYSRTAENKFEVCACALTSAQKDVDYDDFKKTPSTLGLAMRISLSSCS